MANETETIEVTRRLSCVAIYCGAKSGSKSSYGEKAEELGAYLACKNIAVVYGGSRFGLMGKMADSVLANNGKLTGITPKFFTDYDHYSAAGEEVIVPDMHTRKKMVFDMAQAFIALPGGIGTMEELTEVITWAKLMLHSKPIALLNVDGFYDHFLLWLQRGVDDGFISSENNSIDDFLIVSHDPKTLVDTLCTKWEQSLSTAE